MSRTMYLVVRRALKGDGTQCDNQFVSDTGSRVPLLLFAERAAAQLFATELFAEARRTMNPFHLLEASLSDAVRKQLGELALPVACPDDAWHEEWRAWWDLCQDLISDEQRARVWSILGESPPYEVVEIEVE